MPYFTNQIFSDLDFEKYVQAFKTSKGIKFLDYYDLEKKERKVSMKVDYCPRVETENLCGLIKDEFTDDDIEKLERNRRIFG